MGYTLPATSIKPRLIAEYDYAGSDFITLYPTPHDKYGLADQVGWRNIHHLRYGLEVKPHSRLTLVTNLRNWWRADTTAGLYNASGTLIVPAGKSAATFVGRELSVVAAWTISKQMQASGGVGHIFPGPFLRQSSPGAAYTYPYVLLNYVF